MLKTFARILSFVCLAVLVASCSGKPTTLTQIQQQRAGDYVVTIFGEGPSIKQHSNKLTLEIRNAASNELANVRNVQVQSSMRMPGMGPMFGEIGTMKMVSAGKYEFNADFSMAGQWSFIVTFEPNGRAQFNLNAQ